MYLGQTEVSVLQQDLVEGPNQVCHVTVHSQEAFMCIMMMGMISDIL